MTKTNHSISSGIFIKNQEISFEKAKISIISSKAGIWKTTLMLEIANPYSFFLNLQLENFVIFKKKYVNLPKL
jgi:hypothetical protein